MYTFTQIAPSVIWDNDEVVEADGADIWWCSVMNNFYYFMPVEICVNLHLTVDLETGVQTIHYITVCKMWKCDI